MRSYFVLRELVGASCHAPQHALRGGLSWRDFDSLSTVKVAAPVRHTHSRHYEMKVVTIL